MPDRINLRVDDEFLADLDGYADTHYDGNRSEAARDLLHDALYGNNDSLIHASYEDLHITLDGPAATVENVERIYNILVRQDD